MLANGKSFAPASTPAYEMFDGGNDGGDGGRTIDNNSSQTIITYIPISEEEVSE